MFSRSSKKPVAAGSSSPPACFLATRNEPFARFARGSTRAESRIGVVCTQVLEAGVNLSFRTILRARPIFSSVIQTAGRANRHGEGEPADVVVFPFVRDDGKEARTWIYKDKDAIRFTDEVLDEAPGMPEADVARWLKCYYDRCWEANRHLASLECLEAAAKGQWSRLAENEPFQDDRPGLDVFIPRAERFLPRRYQRLLDKFGVTTAQQLLDCYLDRVARRVLSRVDRQLQSALLRQFLVDVPKSLAMKIAHPINGRDWPLIIDNPRAYRRITGLAHLGVDDPCDEGTSVC